MSESSLLILGSGEIARCLARLVDAAGWPVTVCEPDVADHEWPAAVRREASVYADAPWPLPAGTHAVIARGHEGDPDSVAALLGHGAERVYLIASARRAANVLDEVAGRGIGEDVLARVSGPAGLDLGGQGSAEIALSILAEMQWRRAGCRGELRPAVELRGRRLDKSREGQRFSSCPGQRR